MKKLALVLLVVGGLVHLAPGHLTPIVALGSGYLTLQRAVGLLSVVLGLLLLSKGCCCKTECGPEEKKCA